MNHKLTPCLSHIAHMLSKFWWPIATLEPHQNPPSCPSSPYSHFDHCLPNQVNWYQSSSLSLHQYRYIRWDLELKAYRWVGAPEMQLHISPSLRHVAVLPGKGVREFIGVKIGLRRVSYRMMFYMLLFFTFLLRFLFVMTAVDDIEGESKCSTIGKFISTQLPSAFLS